MLVTADHGNVEQMQDPENNQTRRIPVISDMVIGESALNLRPGGSLCDVAPTLLDLMQLGFRQK